MQTPTPMMKQYHEIKARHQDAILFFRLGDFYEMFFDDATTASGILDLVLTARGSDGKGKIPMCGIPYHTSDTYIAKLIKAGKKVAICEQIEDPSLAQGIVKRDVIRIISAGTYLDESTEARYLIALNLQLEKNTIKTIGIAFMDSAKGSILCVESNLHGSIELLAKLTFAECLYPESQEAFIKELLLSPQLKARGMTLSPMGDWSFNTAMAYKSLCSHFGTQSLKGFGIEDLPIAQGSAGALLEYQKTMNKTALRHIDSIALYAQDTHVFLSPAAHYGLEIESLRQTIDLTITPMGRRAFRFWLYHPLKDVEAIKQRQEAAKILSVNEKLKETLKNLPDLDKALSRLACGCDSIKDILHIQESLLRVPLIKECLAKINHPLLVIDDLIDLRQLLTRTINTDIPLAKPEGKMIKAGIDDQLDELKDILENGKNWLSNYQVDEIKKTGINSLKVGFNNVFGFYIEITKTRQELVPANYIRKQTLVNAERYITPELKTYEEKFLTAQDKILAIERRIINDIKQAILKEVSHIHSLSHQLAHIDCLYALGQLSCWPQYIFPDINASTILDIKDGRHPVVEKSLTDNFIANDTLLDTADNHLIILTGPNMAGKSTYIRQSALLVIMAQMGAPIPAAKANIGIVDKIFTRIGAHDDIAKGQSTFMVEMTEAAEILNNLSPRALVILDEIGRGTSTSDGLSLAWGIAEHMHAQGVRTLFATHFHELTALANQLSGVKNYNVAVREWKDKIIFMHKIIPGGSDDSYGIYVAKLAGIPERVIQRSKEILLTLETTTAKPSTKKEAQLNLFSEKASTAFNAVHEELMALDINHLTPLDALRKLNELKNLIPRP